MKVLAFLIVFAAAAFGGAVAQSFFVMTEGPTFVDSVVESYLLKGRVQRPVQGSTKAPTKTRAPDTPDKGVTFPPKSRGDQPVTK